ncbi:Uma2 family endonuclease [Alkalinema sp. FACHB-956]|uniref:Uma2 family endonuclease n=1 Tax=Alkalinema sp. FACHB-956 TaxID=2692768 RepID=UPI0016838AAD|nr:Uma2 family endonuclease [Alkalinema sp. FACHB-956]MBD2326724.1 Uma2 family endonuclease [Alkalinema sp. FACHB-956]
MTQFQLPTTPPLENGDRLTRAEFERRYQTMPHLKKAELIEGVVYLPAALRFKTHADPHSNLLGWLWSYKIATPGLELGVEPTVRLDMGNEPQPDAALFISEACGGQAQLSQDDYIEGAPELLAEIAGSSVAIDLGDKKQAYQRNGVQEYIVWRVYDRAIDWFILENGLYTLLPMDNAGVIHSRIYPGLWLSVNAMLSGEMQAVMATLQAGLRSAEHAAFVQRLATS